MNEQVRGVLTAIAAATVALSVFFFFAAERAQTSFFRSMGAGAHDIRQRLSWGKRLLLLMAIGLFLAFIPLIPLWIRDLLFIAMLVAMLGAAYLTWRGWDIFDRATRRMGRRW